MLFRYDIAPYLLYLLTLVLEIPIPNLQITATAFEFSLDALKPNVSIVKDMSKIAPVFVQLFPDSE